MPRPGVQVLLTALLAGVALLLLAAEPTPTHEPSPEARRPAARSGAVKQSKRGAQQRRRARSREQQPTAERIREIQQALIRAGYLASAPTGKWDTSTVQAMRRFQKAHGHSETGKPDALSLIKLGLGPETAGKAAPRPASGEAVRNAREP